MIHRLYHASNYKLFFLLYWQQDQVVSFSELPCSFGQYETLLEATYTFCRENVYTQRNVWESQ